MSDDAAGDSSEQREAEPEVLAALSSRIGVALKPKRLALPNGGWLELFGFSTEPAVLCEACVHQGPLKGGQKRKLMSDAFKLLFAERVLGTTARKIIALADEEAAQFFSTKAWISQAFPALGIEVVLVDLRPELRAAIREAQGRQFR